MISGWIGTGLLVFGRTALAAGYMVTGFSVSAVADVCFVYWAAVQPVPVRWLIVLDSGLLVADLCGLIRVATAS